MEGYIEQTRSALVVVGDRARRMGRDLKPGTLKLFLLSIRLTYNLDIDAPGEDRTLEERDYLVNVKSFWQKPKSVL